MSTTDTRSALVQLQRSGLAGEFVRPYSRDTKTWGDPITPEPGGEYPYGSWDTVEPKEATAFLVSDATGSDYSGGDYTVANFRYLKEQAGDMGFTVYGGHGTYGWALILDTPEVEPDRVAWVLDELKGLADYPVLCGDMVSEVDMEWEQEAWDSWARDDFRRELRKVFPGDAAYDAIDELSDADLASLFFETAEAISEYWETENSGSYIDVEKIARAVPRDTFPAESE